jgi:hypothetical protein
MQNTKRTNSVIHFHLHLVSFPAFLVFFVSVVFTSGSFAVQVLSRVGSNAFFTFKNRSLFLAGWRYLRITFFV